MLKIVNQNPQPEVYTTRHAFTTAATQGTNVTTQIFTNQAHNEEVRVYGLMVNIVNTSTGDTISATANEFFDVSIQAGPNRIPSTAFSARNIHRSSSKSMMLSGPVLLLHRQPLQVNVEWTGASSPGANVTVVVTLLAEMYIQEV